MAKINGTKVTTNEVRMSYAQVFEPKAAPGSTEEKYSVSLLIPKTDTETIQAIEQGIAAAQQAGVEKYGKKFPANPKTTFRDGDEERPDDPAYKGHMFLNCSSKTKPGIIKKAAPGSGVKFVEITDESDFYSGCYGKAIVNFFAYDAQGNRGVSAGLNNLMKTRDGEAFAGKAAAEDDFADEFEDEDDDFLG
ncbi:DUF2815 family protein [Sporosarcina trichiuri]|uniref:DUF2815 family protein n=1 Tax=Sporosarcina trichiuri TaxID=3056445 RepID=UPI0025B31F2C|nr:DUF2815 family protein [Sporosarcina sp. 0.2-SM1T-5]WJY27424.1 DUF2815 family protein [Sporosarcina sp. 0.2-SM1T-5]WJY27444.1 DUF2815 family protein [Sporosarcina sp. 0.2-SM1T-5]